MGSVGFRFWISLRAAIVLAIGCGLDDKDDAGDDGNGSGDDGDGTGDDGDEGGSDLGESGSGGLESGGDWLTDGTGDETGTPVICEVEATVDEAVPVCQPPTPEGDCGACDEECQQAAVAAAWGCSPVFDSVLCGPELTYDGCCFVVGIYDEGCAGRAWMIDGRAHTAGNTRRDDWSGSEQPGTDDLTPAGRRAIGRAWQRVAEAEHASIASFARFALDLLAMGAPAELVEAAQRAMGDEVQHARSAFALAGSYLGEAVGPQALVMPAGLDRSPEAIVVAAVIEGCVGETVAAAQAACARDRARDRTVRAALARIAAEEEQHAALAFRFVAWALRERPALAPAIAAAFNGACAGLGFSGPEPIAAEHHAAAQAHGVLSRQQEAAIAAEVRREILVPAAASLCSMQHAVEPRASA